MRCGLTRLLLGDQRFLEVQQSQHDQIRTAGKCVFNILQIEERFIFLIENFRELEGEALSNTFQHTTLSTRPWSEIISDIHLFNRRIINLLTTSRLYLDHTPHILSAIFPKDNTVKSEFKKVLSEQYDNSFAYRLLEALRNVVQHRGLPLSGITRNSRLVDSGNPDSDFENTMQLYVDPSKLIDDKNFKRSVAKEFESNDGPIDLRPEIREYIAIIAQAHQFLRSKLDATFNTASNIVNDAISQYYDGDANRKDSIYVVQENAQQEIESKYFLDRKQADRRTEMVGRYSNLSSIHQHVATSAPPQ